MRLCGLLAGSLLIAVSTLAAGGHQALAASAVPTLVAIRAAHHPGLDRVVLEFTGGLPAERTATFVPQLVSDPTGQPVPLAGDFLLRVRLAAATGHDDQGRSTYGATRRAYALPNVVQVVDAGDANGVLSLGIGLARATSVRLYTLTSPDRVVLDIDSAFRVVDVRVHFLDESRLAAGTPPYTRAVNRPVLPPALARGALHRLFAGPTEAELDQHLRFVGSAATGFARLSVTDGIARVRLTGGCSSGGSTFSVADEIMPTLRQFPSVRWVKVYDPAGATERPDGLVDSIPECLEP
ncbi:hypothetical protein JOF53_000939 [Crossiella equi]|uniref:GerMN domain-containing protein n=1 Tax=Crossiella equi TaxID=130796 RepID=A0ABS5A755_9PSEU|nr:hypothetical protein [Crossiella equi]MBP2472067.1 hypothetical protein [Crossiella equi]